ncbi:MAG TPA: hypothetical protein PLA94_08915 [Myxococcota bacterium]|nr:hypothetical protein [Myxococcota bacterium]
MLYDSRPPPSVGAPMWMNLLEGLLWACLVAIAVLPLGQDRR